MDQGFIDLRQNHGHSGIDHSFWPSFTDIMMVVVMIFIMASTILILRNWELVSELRRTLEAEREARQEVTAAMEAGRSLETQLSRLQQALSEAQIENLRLEEQGRSDRGQLAHQRQQMLVLGTERDQLQGELQSARREQVLLGDQLARARDLYQQLQQDYSQQALRLEETRGILKELEGLRQENLAQIGRLSQERAAVSEQFAALQGEYTRLEEKYQRLIRPARSAQGKQVAEVHFSRSGGRAEIRFRTPGESEFRRISEPALHQALEKLKGKHGKDLYVKVIIPADSGLSYSEAWDFTRTLLNRYDYYYQ